MKNVILACATLGTLSMACASDLEVGARTGANAAADEVPLAQVAGSDAGGPVCQKGKVKASEVVFIGESFIAATNAIPRNVSQLARTAGVIGSTESYRSFAVSGTQLTTGDIPRQYTRAKAQSPVKVVLMDGGGNDLLMNSHCKSGPASCEKVIATITTLFKQMASDGVTDVLYFFYPDPMGIGARIKPAMDVLRPQVEKLCAETTDVRCTWVDQRESWAGKYDRYTADGIHPTAEGSAASAKQIWEAMVARCIAQ